MSDNKEINIFGKVNDMPKLKENTIVALSKDIRNLKNLMKSIEERMQVRKNSIKESEVAEVSLPAEKKEIETTPQEVVTKPEVEVEMPVEKTEVIIEKVEEQVNEPELQKLIMKMCKKPLSTITKSKLNQKMCIFPRVIVAITDKLKEWIQGHNKVVTIIDKIDLLIVTMHRAE